MTSLLLLHSLLHLRKHIFQVSELLLDSGRTTLLLKTRDATHLLWLLGVWVVAAIVAAAAQWQHRFGTGSGAGQTTRGIWLLAML